ncbi:MAG: DNA/RNA non-specific endonuclease [Leptothrix sp. (in: b-proteobacteria)]
MKKSTLFLFSAVLLHTLASAATTACPEHYAHGVAPDVQNQSSERKLRELCFRTFGVLHSGFTLTPLWSAEHLTPSMVMAAATMKRKNAFHAERSLPDDERAVLDDYKGSGYDKGHMSGSGDMPDMSSQHDSFSLANMVPQARRINEGLWEAIEKAVRSEVSQGHSLYVITGPLFEGGILTRIAGRVAIPTRVFKAVYDPQAQTASAYVATNEKTSTTKEYDVITIEELEHRLKINLFPAMPDKVKQTKVALPQPTGPGYE